MWIEEADEILKTYLPYYFLLVLPIFIIVSPANPVTASYEFPVYRMQHFDLHGISHGCRNAIINLEARSLSTWSTSRHCIVARLEDLTVDLFYNLRSKAGALILVLPKKLSVLSREEKEHFLHLENAMLSQELSIPVYFAENSADLDKVITDLSSSPTTNDKTKSGAVALLNSIAANGYQIAVNPGNPNAKPDVKIATIQGVLTGNSPADKSNTIAIVAHYDAFGVAPDLSYGANSNGSGVAMLLELVRLFSLLYSDPKTQGKYNIVFLLTGGGKINYQGSKKWLEDQLDSVDTSFMQETAYVMCLDSVASSDSIYMHVSKPPKEGAASYVYFNALKEVAESAGSSIPVDIVHKKINLADDLLAWEHERYSIRRLPSFTLSSLKTHKDPMRSSILDIKDNLNIDRLVDHTTVVAEALARHIYNISGGNIFKESYSIQKSHLEAWLSYLSSQPRSPQLLSNKDNVVINSLNEAFNRYLREVKISYLSPDKRDPDFTFYGVTKGIMNVYSVKPAVFDLVLTVAIALYLFVVYLVIQKFPYLYTMSCNIISYKKVKVN